MVLPSENLDFQQERFDSLATSTTTTSDIGKIGKFSSIKFGVKTTSRHKSIENHSNHSSKNRIVEKAFRVGKLTEDHDFE